MTLTVIVAMTAASVALTTCLRVNLFLKNQKNCRNFP